MSEILYIFSHWFVLVCCFSYVSVAEISKYFCHSVSENCHMQIGAKNLDKMGETKFCFIRSISETN
jgi:hypothetical protein